MKKKRKLSNKSLFIFFLLYFFVLYPALLFILFLCIAELTFLDYILWPAISIIQIISGAYVTYYYLDRISPRASKILNWSFGILMVLLTIYAPISGHHLPLKYFEHELLNTSKDEFSVTEGTIDKRKKKGRGWIYFYTFELDGKKYRSRFVFDAKTRFNQKVEIYYSPSNPMLSMDKEYYIYYSKTN